MSTTIPVAVPNEIDTKAHIDFFAQIPALDGIVSDPSMVARQLSWHANPDNTSETLFGRTLNTATTFPHFLILVPGSAAERLDHLVALLHLGTDVAGHAGICHGGTLSTILDELMGTLVVLYNADNGKQTVTARLSVNFSKPVTLPGIIMVKARVVKVEGRKCSVSAEALAVRDTGADLDDKASASGEALFIELRDK